MVVEVGWISEKFHRMGSPRFFYSGAWAWVIGLYAVGVTLLLVGCVWGLFFVPAERLQGGSFRIMFIHVPTAHLSQMVYIAIAVAGFVHLVWRMKMADVFMAAAAPTGCALAALALLSGIIWGIPTWGTGWVWDARTISMLLLFFLFFGLVVLRVAIENKQRAAFAISVLAIVGVLNIPIIKYSVDWFTTLHQPASIDLRTGVAIAPVYLWPLLLSIGGMYVFVAGVILASMRTHVLRRNAETQWVEEQL